LLFGGVGRAARQRSVAPAPLVPISPELVGHPAKYIKHTIQLSDGGRFHYLSAREITETRVLPGDTIYVVDELE